MLPELGKALVIVGALILLVGLALTFSDRLPVGRVGRLPGDIVYRRGSFTFYFPIVTSILLSLLLTLLFALFGRR
jgi:hypothetical protein